VKQPDDIRQILHRRFQRQSRKWLAQAPGEGQWPLEITLGIPTEQVAKQQIEHVRAWVNVWQRWHGAGVLHWRARHWNTLGVQRLPEKLCLHTPEDVAAWIDQTPRWERARVRYRAFTSRWPGLTQSLPRYFDVLADYGDSDFQRLGNMLDWLNRHPDSNLYPRQIPVAGLDSKWLESRKGLVGELSAAIRQIPAQAHDFYTRCGLRPPPQLIRMRVLDPQLRARLGGLGDISVPDGEIAGLDIRPARVFIVENLQTGLAFADLPDTVVFMGLGYAVDVLGNIPWLRPVQCVYWGDIDTHGLAILNRVRTHLPHLDTLLMDEVTLMRHRALWGEEKEQHAAIELPLLTHSEQALYHLLKRNTLGQHVRLEQERIDWNVAWTTIQTVINCDQPVEP